MKPKQLFLSKISCLTIFSLFLLLFSTQVSAQTTFWSDDFDPGGAATNNHGVGWTMGGTSGSFMNTSNEWWINTSATCSSGSKLYVHAIGDHGGPDNLYLSDVNSDLVAETPDISTVGMTGITMDMTWRMNGEGSGGLDYGLVGYSINSGGSYTWLPTQYMGQSSCVTATGIAFPASCEGITGFRIGFRFLSNSTHCSACDPPFNVDDILVKCATCSSLLSSINTGSITGSPFCAGDPVSVSFTATGTANAGNTFTAQLSDSTGNFTGAINIGTLSSTTPATINAAIPFNTLHGNHYRIRVVSSDPVVTGADNGSDITIGMNPAIISPSGTVSMCKGSSTVLSANADATISYQWLRNSAPITGATNQTFTATKAGRYSVKETTNAGCRDTSVSTTIKLLPRAVVTALGGLEICQTGSVVLQANGGAGLTYQWKKNNVNIKGATSRKYTAATAGSYKVLVSQSPTCKKTSPAVIVTDTCASLAMNAIDASTASINASEKLSLYPNPSSGTVIVTYHSANAERVFLKVFDITGKPVFNSDNEAMKGNNTYHLDLSPLSTGVYYLELSNNTERSRIKFVIEK
jgi:hypothetical protein